MKLGIDAILQLGVAEDALAQLMGENGERRTGGEWEEADGRRMGELMGGGNLHPPLMIKLAPLSKKKTAIAGGLRASD